MKNSYYKFSLNLLLIYIFLFFLVNYHFMVSPGFAIDNNACFMCHGKAGLTKTLPNGQIIPLTVDKETFDQSVHHNRQCTDCHRDITTIPHKKDIQPVNCSGCHFAGNKIGAPDTEKYAEYRDSVHGKALLNGNPNAPTCKSCHGTHDIRHAGDLNSRVSKPNVAKTCGACHLEIYADYKTSVHGRALAKGIFDAPTCTDCHGEHNIKKVTDTSSPVSESNVVQTCSDCHASARMMKKYNIDPTKVKTYMETFHGAAHQLGDQRAAVCIDCHTAHNIRPQSDPASSINLANLPKTCGQPACHPRANINWTKAKIHVDKADMSDPTVIAIRWFYLVMIPLTLLSMLLYNALELRHEIMLNPPILGYERMNRNARIQHAVLLLSFITLVITGFAKSFPDSPFSILFVKLIGGFQMRSWIHRTAALVFIGLCLFHFCYILFTKEGRQELYHLLPRLRDARELRDTLLYFIGRKPTLPNYERFTFVEKSEYWAVVWGGMIMIPTGLIIWFKEYFMQTWPKWVIDMAVLIHFFEAVLATLAILIWHLFHVFVLSEEHPVNRMWWHGKMSYEEWMKKHPDEFKREQEKNPDDINNS